MRSARNENAGKTVPVGHPRVSAIVPVYNVEPYLDRCLCSIVAQTVPFDEVVLVDDGSTDRSGEICDLWAGRYSYFKVVHQKNQGLSAARNAGIDIYQGDFAAFIDSDDWIEPDFVEALLDLAVRTGADIAIGQFIRTDGEMHGPTPRFNGKVRERVYDREGYMRVLLRIDGNRAVHYAHGKLYHCSVIERGHFPKGVLNEDVEGAFKFALNASRVAETSRVLYCYYRNALGITGGGFGENYSNLRMVWERVTAIAMARAPEWAGACRYNTMRADFTVLCDMLLHGDAESDRRYERLMAESLSRLRGNLMELLGGPMAIDRKIMAVGVAMFYRQVRSVLRAFSPWTIGGR